jgi:hypothetical protein
MTAPPAKTPRASSILLSAAIFEEIVIQTKTGETMTRRRKSKILLLPWLACVCAASLLAQESRPITTKELVERAQKIVVGEVIQQHSAWDELGREIYTYSALRVQYLIKSSSADTMLVVRQLGGRVGAIESHVSGAPHFLPGERVLVMLGPYAGTPYFDLIDMREAKYVIRPDSNRRDVLSGLGAGHGQRMEEFVTALRRYL